MWASSIYSEDNHNWDEAGPGNINGINESLIAVINSKTSIKCQVEDSMCDIVLMMVHVLMTLIAVSVTTTLLSVLDLEEISPILRSRVL